MVRTRFAPSPTGSPHVGSAYTALFNYVFAKQKRGKFILRIEDTDRRRYVPEAETELLESLKWLGLNWDEGPIHQSKRLEIYQKYAQELVKDGAAYKDKKAIRQKIPKDGETKFVDLVRGEISFKNKDLDESVLLKSDGFPTYHLAVVVDDHLMEITHIIRGEEWISSTPKHILLYQALGWEPPKFIHLPLLRAPSGAKLGKRFGHASLLWFKKKGFLPEALLNYLALLGWSHPEEREIFGLAEMIKVFSPDRISTSAPVFDLGKLEWLNGVYIRKKSKKELVRLIEQFAPKDMDATLINRTIPLVQERIVKLSDYPDLVDFLVKEIKCPTRLLIQKGKTKMKTKKAIMVASDQLSRVDWQVESIEKVCRDLAKKLNWKTRDFFMTLRVAITGKTATPPLFESMELLGKEKTINRLKTAIKSLE